ncbi:MAG: Hsp20/alpha crystallin family protein [Fimbriimonadaceae bacterium]|nr:Hsp20/alpha crystallin family protein [Fimbriimonadaceae bacterium]QYK57838.1 MAG: Hsp20/alpha crystallin family protein [Fimbriimonadaceae bacterium]
MSRRDVEEWLLQIGTQMSRLSSETAPLRPNFARRAGWEPRYDLFETENEVILKVELPGIRPDQFVVHYSPDRHSLLIRGERTEPQEGSCQSAALHIEIDYGEFAREVPLPDCELDFSRVRTSLAQGILVVRAPKAVQGVEFQARFTVRSEP